MSLPHWPIGWDWQVLRGSGRWQLERPTDPQLQAQEWILPLSFDCIGCSISGVPRRKAANRGQKRRTAAKSGEERRKPAMADAGVAEGG